MIKEKSQQLFELRQHIQKLEAEHEEKVKPLKEQRDALHIMDPDF